MSCAMLAIIYLALYVFEIAYYMNTTCRMFLYTLLYMYSIRKVSPHSAGPKGGPEGHVPPPPEEAKSALKKRQKPFFSCTAERKGGGRGHR